MELGGCGKGWFRYSNAVRNAARHWSRPRKSGSPARVDRTLSRGYPRYPGGTSSHMNRRAVSAKLAENSEKTTA